MPWFRASTLGWFLFAFTILFIIGMIVAWAMKKTWFIFGGDLGDWYISYFFLALASIPVVMILSHQFSRGYDYQEIRGVQGQDIDSYYPADDYYVAPWWIGSWRGIVKPKESCMFEHPEHRERKLAEMVKSNQTETIM